MAHAFQPSHRTPRQATPWRRTRLRRWRRPDDLPSAATLFGAIPSLPRAALSRLTTRMIDRMDEIDGDPDVEPNGDELDGTAGEDDFYPHSNWLAQPGCPVSDPDCCLCREDIGTDHKAKAKLGFDSALGDEDAEEGGDLEPNDPTSRPTYGLDQSRGPISPYPSANS